MSLDMVTLAGYPVRGMSTCEGRCLVVVGGVSLLGSFPLSCGLKR